MQTREENFSSHSLFVALDGIANAENMGVIVRNCSAFGVEKYHCWRNIVQSVSAQSSPQFDGSNLHNEYFHSENLVNDLHFLQDNSTSIIAAHPQPLQKKFRTKFSEKNCALYSAAKAMAFHNQCFDVCTQIVQIRCKIIRIL